ncbi:NADH dehydrogenase (quinone) subunit D [Candidatus Peregrinibacteria bacterium]|nr:NADH dehydrogenase (quinone) subunit D [Candidatus Peregrinibacteria bacterium]
MTNQARPLEIDIEEADLGAKRMIVNFGPQHPATHGTLRNIIELDGEKVVKLTPEIGFLHSGFEKLAEYRTYNQTVVITDRMNYLSPLCNNVGFSIACEELMDIKVTPRCEYIRVMMCELSRIADHILSVGLQAMDLGAFSVMLWTFIEREKLYDIFEDVTGARLTTSYTRVGGLARDLPPGFDDTVKKFMTKCAKTIDEIEEMLCDNKIFLGRTKGIGVISREDAISYGLSGPLLRASGVQHDIRRVRPYSSYEKFDFDVSLDTAGDSYARFRIRIFEMRQSLKIIEQALGGLPSGPLNYHDPAVIIPPKEEVYNSIEGLIYHFKNYMFGHGVQPKKGEVYSCTEAPNGELGFYLLSDGTDKPFRMRVRPPSLYNYQAFPKMCEGLALSDIVAVISSLNIIAGELDR